MMVFDRDGNFLRSWGEGAVPRAHGLHIDADDTLYLTDDGDHTVRKCTPDGKVLLELGMPGKPAPYMSGTPFHRCTHTALSPKGEIYVSDGYGNSRVHKYSPDGKLLMSWGEPGTDPGQFNIVHNIVTDAEGWVYVADRENHRVQVFDGNGKYEAQWNNMHRPCGLYCHRGPRLEFIIGELGSGMKVNRVHPNIGPRVSIVDKHGALIARLRRPGRARHRSRQIHCAARHRARLARGHLRRRGQLYRLAVDASGPADSERPALAAETRESAMMVCAAILCPASPP